MGHSLMHPNSTELRPYPHPPPPGHLLPTGEGNTQRSMSYERTTSPADRTGHRRAAGQGAAGSGAGVFRWCAQRPGKARHCRHPWRCQTAVHPASSGGAAAGRGHRAAGAALRSAGTVSQHRPRRRRPTDQGIGGFRGQGRHRLDRAGAHQRRQGRAFRAPRGDPGRAYRRAVAGDPARGHRRDADSQADALGWARIRLRTAGAVAGAAVRQRGDPGRIAGRAWRSHHARPPLHA